MRARMCTKHSPTCNNVPEDASQEGVRTSVLCLSLRLQALAGVQTHSTHARMHSRTHTQTNTVKVIWASKQDSKQRCGCGAPSAMCLMALLSSTLPASLRLRPSASRSLRVSLYTSMKEASMAYSHPDSPNLLDASKICPETNNPLSMNDLTQAVYPVYSASPQQF